MEKEEKEHLDHLFLGGNKFTLCEEAEKKGIYLLHIANPKTYLLHENRLIVTKQIQHALKTLFVLNNQIVRREIFHLMER